MIYRVPMFVGGSLDELLEDKGFFYGNENLRNERIARELSEDQKRIQKVVALNTALYWVAIKDSANPRRYYVSESAKKVLDDKRTPFADYYYENKKTVKLQSAAAVNSEIRSKLELKTDVAERIPVKKYIDVYTRAEAVKEKGGLALISFSDMAELAESKLRVKGVKLFYAEGDAVIAESALSKNKAAFEARKDYEIYIDVPDPREQAEAAKRAEEKRLKILLEIKSKALLRKSIAEKTVDVKGSCIFISSEDYYLWRRTTHDMPCEKRVVIPLTEKEPVIKVFENGRLMREYVLRTENDEDFTGKFFHAGIRLYNPGGHPVPVVQIDGFVSDTPMNRKIAANDVGYRFEAYFISVPDASTPKDAFDELNREIRGADLEDKALRYPGIKTPSNIRLIGFCPECRKSFAFHGYHVADQMCDAAYSDDGLDVCAIEEQNIDPEKWKCEIEGKTFRYYNSFRCPHCGEAYIDYNNRREIKKFGVLACTHLGRKCYRSSNGVSSEEAEPVSQPAAVDQPEPKPAFAAKTSVVIDTNHIRCGVWHQYEFLLNVRCGWDNILDIADNLLKNDLANVSSVTTAEIIGAPETERIGELNEYGEIGKMPSLKSERGILCVAGNSNTLCAPAKICFMNQLNRFRVFTLLNDDKKLTEFTEKIFGFGF